MKINSLQHCRFRSIPSIIFFSALFSLAYRMNLIQPIVKLFAKLFQSKVKLSGVETLAGVSNIFLGMESALVVFPYIKTMTRSELAAFLTCSFGTISSTVLGMYALFLKPSVPEITNHFMLASVLTIPACFIMAKIIVPERETPITLGDIPVESEEKKGFLASLLAGGMDGGRIAFGIIVGIIVVTGIVALLNSFFDSLSFFKDSAFLPLQFISMKNILGVLFFPLTFFTGISFDVNEIWLASNLIGQRVFQTSIPSYIQLQQLHRSGEISDRGLMIISYVLCGFAHIPAIGIFIGGLSGLIPNRMEEICSLTWKTLWAATLATLMTGAFVGLFSFKL